MKEFRTNWEAEYLHPTAGWYPLSEYESALAALFHAVNHETLTGMPTRIVVGFRAAWECEGCGETDIEFQSLDASHLCEECGYEAEDARAEQMEWLREQDPEAWWAAQPMTTHRCQGCGVDFQAQTARGSLGYCDGCADRIEMGVDVHA